MAHPRAALAAIRRVLKPGGALLWSEADASDNLEENLNPAGRMLDGVSTMIPITRSSSLADRFSNDPRERGHTLSVAGSVLASGDPEAFLHRLGSDAARIFRLALTDLT